ncbi:hypothetical protein B0O99DRAFT_526755, partial [Bisporella sp. PMI_857]
LKAEFHASLIVVAYNAAALMSLPDKDSIFSVLTESVALDLDVGTISPYVAAQQAVTGWEMLPKETRKTSMYTGNIMNISIMPMPLVLDLGIGKSASALWIGLADTTYSARGFRFFYADERHGDGKFKEMALDGAAHGKFYAQLANHEESVPWHTTFVKDKGYVPFR